MPDFETLLDAHVAAQTGCYVSGVDILPEGGRYLWSATLAEPSLNLAVGGAALAQVRAAAQARGRMPALLVTDGADLLATEPGFAGAYPTAWMMRPVAAGDAELADGAAITVSSRPSDDFFRVARTLYDDPAIRAAAEAYVGVLAGAETPVQVSEAHLVLTDGGVPVAAASLYQVGALAGLYNVGTRAEHQKRGFGRAVTCAALAHAARNGADAVFLQCAGHGPVERLYAGLGFTVVERPALVCFLP